jgi:transposase-like protein
LTRFGGHLSMGTRSPGRVAHEETGVRAKFRAEAVALYRTRGRSMREVAQDHGVSNESLRRWIQQADTDEGGRNGLTTTERREIRELRRRSAPSSRSRRS